MKLANPSLAWSSVMSVFLQINSRSASDISGAALEVPWAAPILVSPSYTVTDGKLWEGLLSLGGHFAALGFLFVLEFVYICHGENYQIENIQIYFIWKFKFVMSSCAYSDVREKSTEHKRHSGLVILVIIKKIIMSSLHLSKLQ
jgi:hypothetical protein